MRRRRQSFVSVLPALSCTCPRIFILGKRRIEYFSLVHNGQICFFAAQKSLLLPAQLCLKDYKNYRMEKGLASRIGGKITARAWGR
jgi:hypothetical protein